MSEQQLSPVALRIAVGLAVLLVVGVGALSLTFGSDDSGSGTTTTAGSTTEASPRTGPVALVAVDAPAAGSAECTSLVGALPDKLPNADNPLRRLPIAEPAPRAAAAWGGTSGEPLVLRCGLNRPAELTPTSVLRDIDGVQWLVVEGVGARTWYVVDRAVYVALTVPEGTGTGPLQEVSATVEATLPPTPIRTGS